MRPSMTHGTLSCRLAYLMRHCQPSEGVWNTGDRITVVPRCWHIGNKMAIGKSVPTIDYDVTNVMALDWLWVRAQNGEKWGLPIEWFFRVNGWWGGRNKDSEMFKNATKTFALWFYETCLFKNCTNLRQWCLGKYTERKLPEIILLSKLTMTWWHSMGIK